MKRHKIYSLVIIFVLVLIPTVSYSSFGGIKMPLGGRVIVTQSELSATIVCTAQYGPFMIQPFNKAPAGPYFIQFSNKSGPKKNGYILGLYNATPNTSSCYNPETGAPIPAFQITVYNVSR